MRALLIGDIHIDNRKSSITNSEVLHEIYNLFELIRNTVLEKRPDFVIFFGDLYNTSFSITSPVLTIISELVYELSMYTTILFIVGNHDDIDDKIINVKIGERYVSVRSSLLSPFSYFPNIVVFNKPTVVNIQDNIEVAFIPYTTNIINYLDEANKKFSYGAKRILMGHFGLREGYMENENSSTEILIPSPEELLINYDYDLVLLGHIHDPKEFKINDKIARYIGSSRNVDFRNSGEKKGIYVFDFDTLETEYIDNPYTYIFKILDNVTDLENYCKNNDLEKLSKTKLRYNYRSHIEVKKVSKLKEFFKNISFRKSKISDKTELNNAYYTAINEFEEMINNDLVTKEKIIDYALQFKEPPDRQKAIEILNYIKISDKRN